MIRTALILLCSVASLAAADANRMADALRLKENVSGRDGRHHERGPYQLTRAVWELHMPGQSFALARQEVPARRCALRHLAWLEAQLQARGIPATPFNLAAAWNAGIRGYTQGRAPVRAYLFAGDVERLYHNLHP